MGQAYGRAGARGKSSHPPRPPRQPGGTATPKKQYPRPASSKDPAQTASVVMTRAFSLLIEAVGAENLALGLDLNLGRMVELSNGERFTAETAFHMESALGLPDGYFHQPNAVLTSETIARLRAPLSHRPPEDEPPHLDDTGRGDFASDQETQHTIIKAQAKDADMPGRTSRAATDAADTAQPTASSVASVTAKTSEGKSTSRGPEVELQPSLARSSVPSLLEVRRTNLQLLTARTGSKALLGRLLDMSQSNMAHRLHGKKRLDDAETQRFTEVLGLPGGWLDVPRQPSDVPEAVAKILTPASRARAGAVAKDSAAEPEQQGQPTALGDTAERSSTANGISSVAPEAPASVPMRLPLVSSSLQGMAVELKKDASDHKTTSARDTVPSTAMTDLTGLDGISPIAEALLKTLAGKARTGRLNEPQALLLLQQVVLL